MVNLLQEVYPLTNWVDLEGSKDEKDVRKTLRDLFPSSTEQK